VGGISILRNKPHNMTPTAFLQRSGADFDHPNLNMCSTVPIGRLPSHANGAPQKV
jgi:hypothetical protein